MFEGFRGLVSRDPGAQARVSSSCRVRPVSPVNHRSHPTNQPTAPNRPPNRSAGKSTLLRLIMGREKPTSGRVSLGEHNIIPNYFEQNQAEALDLELNVLDTLIQASPDVQVRAWLCVVVWVGGVGGWGVGFGWSCLYCWASATSTQSFLVVSHAPSCSSHNPVDQPHRPPLDLPHPNSSTSSSSCWAA